MKRILSLAALAVISGCSTIPSNPEPHPEKYTFQVIGIEIPAAEADLLSGDVDQILECPDADITEYPVVVAGAGDSATNDQTTAVAFPVDYNIVDGKAVAQENIQKLGHLVAVTIDEIKDGVIRYQLKLHDQQLKGYDEYNLEDGIAVKMPYFETRGINTRLQQTPDAWVVMGGLVDERSDGTKLTQIIGVRIIAPAQ